MARYYHTRNRSYRASWVERNALVSVGLVVLLGVGIAYYKKWPPLMKFIHAPNAVPASKHPATPPPQPMMPPQQPQQGVHPIGATPGAVASQQQQPGYGFGYGGMPQMGMPMQMPMMQPGMPMMQPTLGSVMPPSPTLMPGMMYGGVV
jgi:hypothetical protein